MAYHTPQYAERLRAHCSRSDLERWKAAAGRAGARSFSAWVRWVLDKEAALVDAAARNPWVDRKTGTARQQRLPIDRLQDGQQAAGVVQIGHERKQKVLRWHDLHRELAKEARGL